MSPYDSQNYVVLDFEIDTSHGDYGHPVHQDNRMLLACWRVGREHAHSYVGREVISHWADEYSLESLLADIRTADYLVAHNAKYELGWLSRCGLDLGSEDLLVFDTKLAEYVLLGNLAAGDKFIPPRSTSLDDCVKRRGGLQKDPVVDRMMKFGVNPIHIPRPWLEERCKQDVITTEWLFHKQRQALRSTGRLNVLETRCRTTAVLAEAEFEGLGLDQGRVLEQHEAHFDRLAELDQRLAEGASGVNFNSGKQLAHYLYTVLGFEQLRDRKGEVVTTPAGAPKTDKATLAALKATTTAQKEFRKVYVERNKLEHALSKNLDFFLGACKEHDGVFHAVFNQTTTATHRLSSSGIPTAFEMFDGKAKSVQFQNLPRAFKPLIKAKRPGWLIGEWDGSALEFRVAGIVSRDRQILKDILDGHDVHTFTALALKGETEGKVTKAARQAAKEHTFKPLYGGKSGTAAQKRYYEAFRQRYPELSETQNQWVTDVLMHGRLVTEWGMRYYWPHARVSRTGYCNVTPNIYNYPIQGLATAEIIPIALFLFRQELRKRGLEDHIKIVNTVHDSVISEVHPDATKEFTEVACEVWLGVYCYLKDMYGMTFDIPLGTEINIGPHWSDEGNEVSKFNIHPTGEIEETV